MESGDLSCAEPRRVAGQRFEIAVDAVERVDDAGLDRVPGTRDRLVVLDGQRLHARGERVRLRLDLCRRLGGGHRGRTTDEEPDHETGEQRRHRDERGVAPSPRLRDVQSHGSGLPSDEQHF